jgi:hypothetical protein
MPPESWLRRNAACVLIALAYLFTFPYFEQINNPNENARVWATRAIVQHHVLNIDQEQREWGWVNDKAKNERHVYSGKAPGASFLGVPVLAAETGLRRLAGWGPPGKREATFWLRLFAVKLPMCVFLWAFARWVLRATGSPAARDMLVVALGLGTLLFPYGNLFVGHALAAAALFGAYMLLAPAEGQASDRALVCAGLLAGASVIFEYQAVLAAAAVAVYAAHRYRARAAAFVAGAVPPALALGAYHTVLFGRPWRFPFGNVENPVFAKTAHAAGFHGLAAPKAAAFVSFLFSADYGLFVFSPVLALGLTAAVYLIVRGPRREGVLIVAVAVLMFLFLAGMSNWRAGWCVGPRYIATVAPFLMMALVRAWPLARGRWWLPAVVAGLVVASVVLNVVSGAVYPHYPEQFDNPVFDLAFPLLGDGYAPYSAGRLLGMHGLASLLPVALVTLAALSLAIAGPDARPARWSAHVGLAVAVAALFLLPLSSYGRAARPIETRAAQLVRATWEPPPSR